MSIVTGADIASHLGINDQEDAPTLDAAAAAATSKIVAYCDREFVKTAIVDASARQFWADSDWCVRVDDFWETTALVVRADSGDNGNYATTLTNNTDFFLEPASGRLYGQPWPYTKIRMLNSGLFRGIRRPALRVTAAWGWADLPDPVVYAARIEGAALYQRKNSPQGVVGGFSDFTPFRVSRFEDPDVESLLGPYRKSDPALYVG